MNSIIEVEELKPEPTFEKTTNDIKYNHLRSISSAAMNLSAITLFDKNLEQLSTNSRIEVAKFKTEPTFEKTNNEVKDNHLKNITSIDMNISSITSNKHSLSYEHLKSDIMPWILLQSPGKSPQFTKHLSSIHPKGNTQVQILKWWIHLRSVLYL